MQDVVSHDRTISTQSMRPSGGTTLRDRTVQAIVRAFAVLDAFRVSPTMSVSELARALHLHKSTVHRLLATLEKLGYVVQDPVTQHYHLGLKVLDLAVAVGASVDIRQCALPTMHRLVAVAQETVHLGVLIDGEVACIESVASDRPVAIMRLVGKRGPAHVSSMGKVLLAHQPPALLDRIIAEKGLPRLTTYSITDPVVFRQHLEVVRAQGWALNAEEEEIGVGCVAAPIRDHRGVVVAALSIAAPIARMRDADLDRLRDLVIEGAREISTALGYQARGMGEESSDHGRCRASR
jgi:IclR family KDG regulon transcriptional repressor